MSSADNVSPAAKAPPTDIAYASSILPSPLQPSVDRTCPACGKRFALKFQQARPHSVVVQVTTYRCRACGHEVEYAQERPAHTL